MIEPGLFFVKKKITIHIIIWVFVPRDYFCDTAKLFSIYELINKAFSLLYIALPIRKNTNETQKGYK